MTNARLAAMILTLSAVAGVAQAGESVIVRCQGREFIGVVDARSTQQVLQLESRGAATRVVRSIPFDRIDSVQPVGSEKQFDRASSQQRVQRWAAKPGQATFVRQAAAAGSQSYAEQALHWLGFGDSPQSSRD